jgi:hypothetical protein
VVPLYDFAIEELGVPRLSSGQRDKKELILDYLLNSDDEACRTLGPIRSSLRSWIACVTPRSDDNPKSKRCSKAVDRLNGSSATAGHVS